jgi:hypothetical protein
VQEGLSHTAKRPFRSRVQLCAGQVCTRVEQAQVCPEGLRKKVGSPVVIALISFPDRGCLMPGGLALQVVSGGVAWLVDRQLRATRQLHRGEHPPALVAGWVGDGDAPGGQIRQRLLDNAVLLRSKTSA